jgi:ATP-binding cassette, subfamily B, bacterial IrtB/YbtQ
MTATVATPAASPESAQQGLRRGGVVRTVWALAGEHRPILARSIGYKAAQGAAMSLPVGVLVALIDRIRSGSLDTGDLSWAVAAVGACVVAQWVFGYLANRSSWIATFEMFGQVRVRALDHLRRLPMRFFDERQMGDTVTAVTQDINSVEIFVHEPMQQLIGAGTAPVVVFLVLLTQDVPLALATMASVVAAVPVFVWANRRFKVLAAQRQDLQAGASSRMIEYVQGLPVIRAFRLAGERLERFRSALDDYRALNTRVAVQLIPPAIGAILIVLLGIPCVLFFGALWLFGGRIDAGTLIVFAVLVLRVYQPLITAAQSVENLRIADASLDRIARVLDEPVQPQPARPGPAPQGHEVAFDGVTFGYDRDRPVLHDVSFRVPQRTMTAIVGPSGAGKSTVLHLLARFADVQRGRVTIGGVDVRNLTAEQLFDAVTVVFQDVYLFPGTIFDNIAFGNAEARAEQVEAAARAARAHDFIMRLPAGYDTPVGEAGATLSGGERQRLSIARAILKDSPVVLLDEATAAIDPTNERHVQAALGELVREKTLIVVAHRLSTIASADQILVLDEGRLVERGRHDDLLAAGGRYARLWHERQRATNWRLDRQH